MLFLISFSFFLVFSDLFCLNTYFIYFIYFTYVCCTINYNTITIVSNTNFNFLLKSLRLNFFKKFYSCINSINRYSSYRPQRKLKWKPLFKKSSYFGLYRSIKNQYLNK